MAFNNLGFGTITPGEEQTWQYWFGGDASQNFGDDHGAQYCMAHPETAGGVLFVTRQGKEQSATQMHHDPNALVVYAYSVTIRCEGGSTVAFSLQGGGLT